MHLVLPPNSLAVFIDETGHERLASGHHVYGLGGCAAMSENLIFDIEKPWCCVREKITGYSDNPLHAHNFPRDKANIVGDFFKTQQFFRLGSILSVDTEIQNIEKINSVMVNLCKRIATIAERTASKELHLIFESAERTNPLIEEAMNYAQKFDIFKDISFECSFMPKSVKNPALEVADFIMHAIQGQVKLNLAGKNGYREDFKAVFHSIEPKYCSFMKISEAICSQKVAS